MARTVREASLATRSARLRLALASKPYWRVIEQGLHLGYRRRATGGSWIARRRNDQGTYHERKLGLADDLQEALGKSILDFSQAQVAARHWCTQEQRLAAGDGTVPEGPYTVACAMADYLDDYRRRGGKIGRGHRQRGEPQHSAGTRQFAGRQAHPATPARLAPRPRRARALLALAQGRSSKPRRLRPQ